VGVPAARWSRWIGRHTDFNLNQPAVRARPDEIPMVVATDLFDNERVVDQVCTFDHVKDIAILRHEMRLAAENIRRRTDGGKNESPVEPPSP